MAKKCLFNNLFVSGFKHESHFALGYMSLESLYICTSLPILFCPAFFLLFGCAAQHAEAEFPKQGWTLCPLRWKCSVFHWTAKEDPCPAFLKYN